MCTWSCGEGVCKAQRCHSARQQASGGTQCRQHDGSCLAGTSRAWSTAWEDELHQQIGLVPCCEAEQQGGCLIRKLLCKNTRCEHCGNRRQCFRVMESRLRTCRSKGCCASASTLLVDGIETLDDFYKNANKHRLEYRLLVSNKQTMLPNKSEVRPHVWRVSRVWDS